ncbi:hypothetical protein BC332_28860, partial [Capsicum chinense]
FDGSAFLRKYKGKQIMFIGDSLSLNNYDSFLCLLYVSVPGVNHHTKSTNQSVTVIFEDYRVSVTLFNSLFLVDVEVEPNIGRVLKLNSIKNGEIWKQADILIVNTWLWWTRGGPKQPWDYIEDTDGKLVKEMNRVIAFRRGLNTWTKWVEGEVDLTKTKVFYQGQAGSHHHGEDWGEPGVKGCSNQTTPVVGSIYPSGLPLPAQIMKQVLKNMTNSIFLLDITILSHLRKDGHPANHNGYSGFDCLSVLSHIFVAMESITGIINGGISNSSGTTTTVIDHHHPLYLQACNTPGSSLVSIQLTGSENYALWSRSMRIGLLGKSNLGFVDGRHTKEKFEPALHDLWEKCNAIVLSWIMISVSKELLSGIVYTSNAQKVWSDLKERFDKVDGSRIFFLHKKITTLVQDTSSVSSYFSKIKEL